MVHSSEPVNGLTRRLVGFERREDKTADCRTMRQAQVRKAHRLAQYGRAYHAHGIQRSALYSMRTQEGVVFSLSGNHG